jgi:Domain of unknown function (DUF6249)
MGHSLGDGIIVVALAAAFLGYVYMKHAERQRRLEIVHQERLAAMEKGIPLPELPIDPPRVEKGPNPQATLVHGIVWTALGIGSMIALAINGPHADLLGSNGSSWSFSSLWAFPLPFVFLGLGLVLYYFLAAERAR